MSFCGFLLNRNYLPDIVSKRSQFAFVDASKFRVCNEAIKAYKTKTKLHGHKMAQLTKTKIIPIGTFKEVLCRVICA